MNITEWLSDLCLLDVSFINTYTADKTLYPMKNAGRNHHGFLYTVKGSETYIFADKTIKAVENSVLYIPKGEQYIIEFEGDTSEVITLDFEAQETLCRPFLINYSNKGHMYNYFFDAEKQWKRMDKACKTMCKSIFYKIAGDIIKQEDTYANTTHHNIMSPSVEYMKKHYMDNDFRIEQLYRISNVSPKYYETLFKKLFNISPKEYVMNLKIAFAKNLLLSEKNSVGEVALKLGYKDMYNFSKIFKKKTGYSPSEYKHLFRIHN